MSTTFSRLPGCVIPINYDLWLRPCFRSFTFDGKVDVTVQAKESINKITLNCAEIKISSATYSSDDAVISANSIIFEETLEKVTLEFDQSLPLGNGVLSISFKGILNDKMKGFYRNRCSHDDAITYGAATQFAATDARRCFPCWDEPALKATFDVSLVVPKQMCSLSNMNIVSEEIYEGDSSAKIIKYAKTPIMSTYLLAIVIGDFDFTEQKIGSGLPVRVYTPKGEAHRGKFALDVAVKALQYYEEYFKIDYPLPKLDLIAIADLHCGAMENWGLITYRETALLIDDENSSAQTRQRVSLIVCHELAHQWFGNLVTMEWWTHLWLNEGFASFMEFLATDFCHPEFNIWNQFISHSYKRALDLDALDSSHPIEVPVKHPDEIDEIFDVISYCKGASVIRMLYNWIGDDCFRKGMHNYLTKHSYKNAATEDLWDALANASDKPVREAMGTWTTQMGYPVIKISSNHCSDGSASLELMQEKFHACIKDLSSDHLWSIPICFSTQNSLNTPVKYFLMNQQTARVVVENVQEGEWLKLNSNCVGFYRVQYTDGMLAALCKGVGDKTLQDVDRLNLISDVFALGASGALSTTAFLQLLSSFKNETSYAVWSELDSDIGILAILLFDMPELYENFKVFVLSLYENIASNLGWDPKRGESHLDSMLRSMVIRRMGKCGHPATIAEARRRFQDHMSGKKFLSADLRSPVYELVLRHPSANELESLLLFFDKVDLQEERERILTALSCAEGVDQMQVILNFAMSDKVRSNNKVSVIGSVAVNSSKGRELAWEFVKSNWDKFHDMYKGTFLISRLVKATTENFTTHDKAQEIETFFSNRSPLSVERTVRQSLETIRRYAEWWKRDGEKIMQWMKG